MFSLTLNNKPAYPQKGTTIKITRKNPTLTDSGDFSLDIVLPLAGCPENVSALSLDEGTAAPFPAHHFQQDLTGAASQSYHCVLIADNLAIEGAARITEIDETSAKLQLKNAALALGGTEKLDSMYSEKVYIDDLLKEYVFCLNKNGGAFIKHPDEKLNKGNIVPANISDYWQRVSGQSANTGDVKDRTARGRLWSPVMDVVFFPIKSTETNIIANRTCAIEYFEINKDGMSDWGPENVLPYLTYFYPDDDASSSGDMNRHRTHQKPFTGQETVVPFSDCGTYANTTIAPQVRLLTVVELLFHELGCDAFDYSALYSQNDPCNRRNIYIANPRLAYNVGDTLPHWTLKEFFQQVQNFLGVRFTFSYELNATSGKTELTAHVVERWAGLDAFASDASARVTLSSVSDERTVEIDSEASTQLSAGLGVSVFAYDFPASNDTLALSEDLANYAQIDSQTAATVEELKEAYNAESDETKKADMLKNIYYLKDARIYAYLYIDENNELQTNRIGTYTSATPEQLSDEDNTYKLNIVPCRQIHLSPFLYIAQIHDYDIMEDGLYTDLVVDGHVRTNSDVPIVFDVPGDTYGESVLLTNQTSADACLNHYNIRSLVEGDNEIPTASKPDKLEVFYVPTSQLSFYIHHTAGISADSGQTFYRKDYEDYNKGVPYALGAYKTASQACHYAYGTQFLQQSETKTVMDGVVPTPEEFHSNQYAPFGVPCADSDEKYYLSYYRQPHTVSGAAISIDARTESTYTFTDVLRAYDPEALYIIRGVPHVCVQLELTIDPETGLQPKKKGKFIPFRLE